MTLREKGEEKKIGGYRRRGEGRNIRGSGTLASLSAFPLSDPLPHNSISSRSKSFLSILYKSWCLYLRELLRVVTVLEVSSASSSSFVSRLLLKNLKMESKLIQEKRSMPQRSLIHPELVVNSPGTPPASPSYPIAVRGHQGGVSVPICR
ncbi:hypothetical protein JOQ06_012359 [Pogonophryne albipinna]|uniref:Uncharacterized protein n=1 Tax=Pogonophryne albipinna TaxID=1090488 RepID=A0AAD6BCZ8_9TELE|nr:hypothetical protein JOQ06_012359 [Pogonophryne albipinna]